jgi:PQQ-dependent dehydrogenase (s-GDH family)
MAKKILIIISYLMSGICLITSAQNESFTMRIVNKGYQLNSAWEVTYGPDDSLWVTENKAYKVSKIDPASGNKTLLLDLSSVPTGFSTFPQGGLMGMALHPTLYSEWPNASKPWVYLAYVYQFNGCVKTVKNNLDSGCFFKTKIVRYQYDYATQKLIGEQLIIDNLNGSSDHNAGRLAIGQVNGTPYLFYTIGDMGTGQFLNAKRKNRAQTRDTLEGKVLRFNIEPDGDAGVLDKWIPNDNPYKDKNGKNTAVWSWGHRNAQGIAFGSNGILYSSEQQDMSDDEVNIIENGRNYGWPLASGYCDGNYNGLTLAGLPVVSEQQDSIANNLKSPIYTLYTVPDPSVLIGKSNSIWPTVACSSIDVYENNVIPDWNRSLLIPSLKAGLIQRLKLDATGQKVIGMTNIAAMNKFGQIRYRDICISPDGLKIYASCDMSSQSVTYQGKILEFLYTGSVLAINNEPLNSYTRNIEIEIYPNPAHKILNVKSIKNVSKPLYYSIYDVTGKLIINGNSKTDYFSINVETLLSGVYIFKLYNNYGITVATKKILIH